jgi:hypothetical protein
MQKYGLCPPPHALSLIRLVCYLPNRTYRTPCSPSKLLDSFLDFLAAFFSFGVMTAFFFSSLLLLRSFDMMSLQIIYGVSSTCYFHARPTAPSRDDMVRAANPFKAGHTSLFAC